VYIYGFSKVDEPESTKTKTMSSCGSKTAVSSSSSLSLSSQNAFGHPYFIKGNKSLCLSMGRNQARDRRRKKPPVFTTRNEAGGDNQQQQQQQQQQQTPSSSSSSMINVAAAWQQYSSYNNMSNNSLLSSFGGRVHQQQQQQQQRHLLQEQYHNQVFPSLQQQPMPHDYFYLQEQQQQRQQLDTGIGGIPTNISSLQLQHHHDVDSLTAMSPIRSTRLQNFNITTGSLVQPFSNNSSSSNNNYNAPAAAAVAVPPPTAGSALLDAETRLFQTGYPELLSLPPGPRTTDAKKAVKWDGSGDTTKVSHNNDVLGKKRGIEVGWKQAADDDDRKSAKTTTTATTASTANSCENTGFHSSSMNDSMLWTALLEPRPIEEMIAQPITRRAEEDKIRGEEQREHR
jgi:hypothetical protein